VIFVSFVVKFLFIVFSKFWSKNIPE